MISNILSDKLMKSDNQNRLLELNNIEYSKTKTVYLIQLNVNIYVCMRVMDSSAPFHIN